MRFLRSSLLLLVLTAARSPAGGAAARATQAVHDKIKALQAEAEADPQAWEPRLELVRLYLRFGLLEKALHWADQVIELKPDHAAAYQLAARAHATRDEYDKAIARLNKALKLEPQNRRVQDWLKRAKQLREDHQKLQKLNATLAEDPDAPEALLDRARIYARRAKWPKALADLKALFAAKPDATEPLGLAAMAHYKLGHLEKAIQFWTRAQEAHPDDPQWRIWLTRARKKKSVHDELTAVKKKLQDAPDDGQLHRRLGELSARLKRWQEAIKHLRRAVALRPKDAETRKAYAWTLLRRGHMDEAIKHLETCVELAPENASYKNLLKSARKTRQMHRAMRRSGAPSHGGPPATDSHK